MMIMRNNFSSPILCFGKLPIHKNISISVLFPLFLVFCLVFGRMRFRRKGLTHTRLSTAYRRSSMMLYHEMLR